MAAESIADAAGVAEENPAQPATFSQERFNQLPSRWKWALLAGVPLLVALLVAIYLGLREPPYQVLFSNLADRDGGQIVAALQQQNIPYKFTAGGSAIMVPADRVHDTRLRLATQGLPKGGQVGFELMENLKLGATQFEEHVAYQRGLEGELARTIESLAAVKSARVHLAIPKQTSFLREDRNPSASVVLTLFPGRFLDQSQIAGVINLVASSVSQLTPANVSVIDQDGNLISKQPDPKDTAGLNPAQLRLVREMESDYAKRVETILTPIVGADNVRSQVSVDMDFSQSEQVAEYYKPNPSPDSAIRSQQLSESGKTEAGPMGVPGALTNQPPVPATAPLTVPPVPGAGAGSPNGMAGNQNYNFSRNATTNYEVDKTIRHTTNAPGMIRRVTVGVLLNYHKGIDKDGKPAVVPFSDEEIKKIEGLVRDAVGYDANRGDSVNVANLPFASAEALQKETLPIWRDPAVVGPALEFGKYLLAFLLLLILWWWVIYPRYFKKKPETVLAPGLEGADGFSMEGATMSEGVDGESLGELGTLMPGSEGAEGDSAAAQGSKSSYEEKLRRARDLARRDPAAVANVIKEWMSGTDKPR